ncbi:aldehyde dehydrogenase family protein [Alcaligenaceae bacterium CGII-47]|nr:aldehyde dehydrogenase family protein [Alcaligenaceae bacterium CGII-47]
MTDYLKFYIDGKWVDPVTPRVGNIIDPYTEQAVAQISYGSAEDVEAAVQVARRAFESFSQTSVADRIALLEAVLAEYKRRAADIAGVLPQEMGAPPWLCVSAQVPVGIAHLKQTIEVLREFSFTQLRGSTAICFEPIGVVGMITPWNWPLNQMMCKIAPALAAGCTMILKPSESAPLSAMLLAEVLHAAGVPPGVFNLVNGTGADVGAALAAHPGIDMITVTGSTRAGIAVALAAAASVKRVTQELGGKSVNIILDDADLQKSVKQGVLACFLNSGQSCNAPTRMLVPRHLQSEAIEIAAAVANGVRFASAGSEAKYTLGPLASKAQFVRVQAYIQTGMDEGATLVAGGLGRPDGLELGYFVKPTIFADVNNDMVIAREEIFGPVLSILPYDSVDEAIRIANDSPFGLSAYVQSDSLERAKQLASQLRTGMVHLNGAPQDVSAPFGGYKQSGNGHEWGDYGFREFLEIKSVMGYAPVG